MLPAAGHQTQDGPSWQLAGELSGGSSSFQIRITPNIRGCVIFLLLTSLLSSGCDILLKARESYQSQLFRLSLINDFMTYFARVLHEPA